MSNLPPIDSLELARQYHQAGRLPQAEMLYRQTLAAQPNHANALFLFGILCGQTSRPAAGIELIGRACALCPNIAGPWLHLGQLLRDTGQLDKAIAAYEKAIQVDPNFSLAYESLAVALADSGRHDAAIAARQKAVALKPADADAYCNLGRALAGQGRIDEAIAAYRQSIALRPAFAGAWTNLGNALRDKGELAEALAACQRAVDLDPADPSFHVNLGIILLSLGDFARGWAEYEWRWRIAGLYAPRPFIQPRWDGRPLNGKTILLHADQGFGDTIQFIRYVSLIARLGGRIVLGCDRPLKRLFEGADGISHVFTDDEPVPPFDVHCPVASLGAVLATTVATIPAAVPYVGAKPSLKDAWRQTLAPFAGLRKIGLAWSGKPTHGNDRNRSISLDRLGPLADERIAFFSLQKGPAAAQAACPPAGMRLIDFTEHLHDFADTAALVSQLDMVICVDTSVAHLAGAMGRPTWVLIPSNPDWRWLIDREDSPWYPTMRLFRQPAMGKWDEVIQRVAAELRHWIAT